MATKRATIDPRNAPVGAYRPNLSKLCLKAAKQIDDDVHPSALAPTLAALREAIRCFFDNER